MNEESIRFIFGGAKQAPQGALCFAYGGRVEAAKLARARMKRRDAEQAALLDYYIPEMKEALCSCPFCSWGDEELVVEKDKGGWYFVFCGGCGARGPRTRDGYLAAAWLWQLLRQEREDPLLDR